MRRVAALVSLIALTLAAGGGGTSPTPVGTPAVTVPLTAKDLAFDKSSFDVPADVTFAVELNNQDGVPHNLAISGNGQSRNSEPFTGPATKTLAFAGLPAGSYTFVCSIHTDMKGSVQVTAAGS